MYITLSEKYGRYKVKVTQTYNAEFDFGHYIAVLEDGKGNIIDTISTVGSVPKGKIDSGTVREYYLRWKRDIERGNV